MRILTGVVVLIGLSGIATSWGASVPEWLPAQPEQPERRITSEQWDLQAIGPANVLEGASREEIERRLHHMRVAKEHLHAAGLDERAMRLQPMIDLLERDLETFPAPAEAEVESLGDQPEEMAEWREQMEAMQARMAQMEERLAKLERTDAEQRKREKADRERQERLREQNVEDTP